MKFLPIALFALATYSSSAVATASTAPKSTAQKKKELFRKYRNKPAQSNNHQLPVEHKHIIAQSRIVGGSVANIDAYPFFVSWEGCGASLIGKEWLLTAAHCASISTNSVKINESRRYGDYGRGIPNTIARRIPHPQYDSSTTSNDFMLMKLESPVVDSEILPLDLNMNGAVPANSDALKVIGFGALSSYGGGFPTDLQEVVVQHVPTNECNGLDSYDGEIVGETMFCAGVNGGGKDSCQGDSGGPIFSTDTDGKFTQVGVVSWGYGCAEANYPGVYSRISGAFDWIKDTVCNDSGTQYKPDFCSGSEVGVEVRLDMTFDGYPEETTWEFLQDGEVVASGAGGGEGTNYGRESYAESSVESSAVSYTYNLEPGSTVFRIIDSASDGICCGYGSGKYEIFSVVDGTSLKMADSNGEFLDVEEKSFIIPDDSTAVGGCEDSVLEEFLVDRVAGNRGCSWLAVNMDNYGYLCAFLDVAAKCKDTCNACAYFQESSRIITLA